jgi:hypothetical protein
MRSSRAISDAKACGRLRARVEARGLPHAGPRQCRQRKRSRLSTWLLLGAIAAQGCAKKETIITPAVAQHQLTAAEIDAEPLAVLPSGFIALLRAEVPAVAGSSLGPTVLALANQWAPLPPNSGFTPERDLDRIVIGLYSMQGADAAGVAIGRFDPDAIQRAVNSNASTPSGTLVQSPYAGRLLYTVHNIGFCPLSTKTLLIGNETGIRRSLDRIGEGRAIRRLPTWTDALLDATKAPIAFGAQFKSGDIPASVTQQAPFMADLLGLRVLGNFQSPGLNLAGSLGYATPERAQQAAGELLSSRDRLSSMTMSLLMGVMGIGQPVRRLEATATGKEVSFVAALDGGAVSKILNLAAPAILSAAAGISAQ